MSLLPSRDPAAPNADPRVIPVDSEDADDVLSALSAATARNLLAELHSEPAPPGELASRVDTSLQNAQYHLEKLEAAGAVEVVDTAYSEKGREMDVYAPANQPLVICAGDDEETTGVRSALTRLLGGVGIVGLGSLVVQQLLGRDLRSFLREDVQTTSVGGGEPGTSFAVDSGVSPSSRITETAGQVAADGGTVADGAAQAASIVPPGLAFFLGGTLVLVALFALWYADA